MFLYSVPSSRVLLSWLSSRFGSKPGREGRSINPRSPKSLLHTTDCSSCPYKLSWTAHDYLVLIQWSEWLFSYYILAPWLSDSVFDSSTTAWISRFVIGSSGEFPVPFSRCFKRMASILSSRPSTARSRSSVETTVSAAFSTILTSVCFLV